MASQDDRLLAAAQAGAYEEAAAALGWGARPNCESDTGRTALCYAAEAGEPRLLTLLLQRGADANKADNRGVTALMLAARKGHIDCVRALLNAGADLAVCDGVKRRSALAFAALKGRRDCVEALLSAGADANAQDDDGKTALHLAAKESSADCVLALLHAGADRFLLDRQGRTAEDVATSEEMLHMLRTVTVSESAEESAAGFSAGRSRYEEVNTQMAEEMEPHELAALVSDGRTSDAPRMLLTSGAARLVADARAAAAAAAAVAAAAPPQLQLMTAGATKGKEYAFPSMGRTLCEVDGPNKNRPRDGNEDAFFIAGQLPHCKHSRALNVELRLAFGGANAAGVADGVSGMWIQHGVSSGRAARHATHVCAERLNAGDPLGAGVAAAHAAVTDLHSQASDGTVAFAAYQLCGPKLTVYNIGDCNVFIFKRGRSGLWEVNHNPGVSLLYRGERRLSTAPVQFGRCSHCHRSMPVNLRDYAPSEKTLAPGDVVLAMSDGPIDCLSTDLVAGGRDTGARSQAAQYTVSKLLQRLAAQWEAERWSADQFTKGLVECLMLEAQKLPAGGSDYKGDDLTVVASVVLPPGDGAHLMAGPPWAQAATGAAGM